MSDQQPVFSIEKLYVKDLSLEVPNAPQVYLEREAPQIEIQLQTGATGLGDDLFESVLTVTVTAKNGENTFFLVEVAKAGIFSAHREIIDDPDLAERLYGVYVEALRAALGAERVATGRFGAAMAVELVNDGPVTIELTTDAGT